MYSGERAPSMSIFGVCLKQLHHFWPEHPTESEASRLAVLGKPLKPCNPATSSGYFQLCGAMSHVPGLIIFDMFYVICKHSFKSLYFLKIWFFYSVFNYAASKYHRCVSVRVRFRSYKLFFLYYIFLGRSIVLLFPHRFTLCF